MNYKTFAAAGLVLATLTAPTFAADKLSPAEIRGLAPGTYAVSVYGLVKLQISFQPGGAISGINGKKKRDTGVWSVEGEKLCIKWTRWLKGKQRCTALSGDNGAYSGGGLYIRKI
jgi:hypothetical protein